MIQLDMIYKKKQMPNMNPKLTNIVKPPILNAVAPMSMINDPGSYGGSMMNRPNGGGFGYSS